MESSEHKAWKMVLIKAISRFHCLHNLVRVFLQTLPLMPSFPTTTGTFILVTVILLFLFPNPVLQERKMQIPRLKSCAHAQTAKGREEDRSPLLPLPYQEGTAYRLTKYNGNYLGIEIEADCWTGKK